ncbi:protein phosphatase 1 regulatory subunit 3F [Protopterus annectens]|uniref:protein phosphatase 1 regulatory subunit 3F n=1 Tax=Protopterus annectens TaxID=7888 RepID=UPI001CFA967A|nr:protein phosphatase 1 regulatory subunit 3F [Protopterus annectens]
MAQNSYYLKIPCPEEGTAGGPEDEDEEEDDSLLRVHLIPRSSPTPRQKSLSEDEEDDICLPPSQSRKVSFADAFGLDLVEVKYYEKYGSPDSPECDLQYHETNNQDLGFYVIPCFAFPAARQQLLEKLYLEKVAVESILPVKGDPLSISGVVRVLNVSYNKMVYIRTTMDNWTTFYDHLADYVPGSFDGETDQFSFCLSFVAPFVYDGARIEFVVRYETDEGSYWANNDAKNYSIVLKMNETAVAAPGSQVKPIIPEDEPRKLKSCLKITNDSNVFKGQCIRAARMSSEREVMEKELVEIYEMFVNRGYPKDMLDNITEYVKGE